MDSNSLITLMIGFGVGAFLACDSRQEALSKNWARFCVVCALFSFGTTFLSFAHLQCAWDVVEQGKPMSKKGQNQCRRQTKKRLPPLYCLPPPLKAKASVAAMYNVFPFFDGHGNEGSSSAGHDH